jgi:hypothetical protein
MFHMAGLNMTKARGFNEWLQTSQKVVSLNRPNEETMCSLRSLHAAHKDYTMWSVDVEFAVPKSVNTVPYSICVHVPKTRNMILFTNVDHGLSLLDLEAELQAHHDTYLTAVDMAVYHRARHFGRHYQIEDTNGMSLKAIGDALRVAGYTPLTHKVLSWKSYHGGAVFFRALLGDKATISWTPIPPVMEELRDHNNDRGIQPFNLSLLLRKCTDLTSVACGFAYRSLFPGSYLFMHGADNDTFAMCCLYEQLLMKMARWLDDA